MYVDDFKMAGPIGNLQKGWDMISKLIKLDPPTKVNNYLGCERLEISIPFRTMTERIGLVGNILEDSSDSIETWGKPKEEQ